MNTRIMTTRIELDFRYGLTESRVEHVPDGARLTITRGQDQLAVLLPPQALNALWLAVITGLPGPAPC